MFPKMFNKVKGNLVAQLNFTLLTKKVWIFLNGFGVLETYQQVELLFLELVFWEVTYIPPVVDKSLRL